MDIFGFVDGGSDAVDCHRREGVLLFLCLCVIAKGAAAFVLEEARIIRAQDCAAKADDSDMADGDGLAALGFGQELDVERFIDFASARSPVH